MDVDLLWLVAGLGPAVAEYGLVLSKTRNSVHDSSLPSRGEL